MISPELSTNMLSGHLCLTTLVACAEHAQGAVGAEVKGAVAEIWSETHMQWMSPCFDFMV